MAFSFFSVEKISPTSLSNHCRKVALSYNPKERVKEWMDLYYNQRLFIDNSEAR